MLIRPHRQESLCRAYVQAVAAQAGLNFSFLIYDYGIDLTLRAIDKVGPYYTDVGIPLDLQLKATTRAKIGTGFVTYDLEARTYEHLRLAEVNRPRILVLLVLPEEESEWLAQTEAELVLRGSAYWMSLRGMPASKARKTIRIAIPRENVLTVQVLQDLMARLKQGDGL